MSDLLMYLTNGVVIGIIYALSALGVSLIVGIMNVVNFAHGELYILAGYFSAIIASALGLAPLVVREIYRALRKVSASLTLLLVEQSVEQALKNSQRAYILETGRVVRQGASAELLADPALKEAYLGI